MDSAYSQEFIRTACDPVGLCFGARHVPSGVGVFMVSAYGYSGIRASWADGMQANRTSSGFDSGMPVCLRMLQHMNMSILKTPPRCNHFSLSVSFPTTEGFFQRVVVISFLKQNGTRQTSINECKMGLNFDQK